MSQFRKIFCVAVCLWFSLSGGAAPVRNVLLIAVDDLKPILGCYGEPTIKTPNIDRLAQSGTVFLNSYCQQAVCGPTRASLLTGLRPDKTQVWDLKTRMRDRNPDILTLPQYFQAQGYTTAGTGKIYDQRCVDKQFDGPSWSIPFVSAPRAGAGEDSQPPVLGEYQSAKVRDLWKQAKAQGITAYGEQQKFLFEHGGWPVVESANVPDQAYADGAIAEQGIRYLEQLKQAGKPFFLAVGFKKPHLPFVAPQKYWDLYQRDQFKVAPFQKKSTNGVDLAYHNSGEIRAYNDIPSFDSFSGDSSKLMPEAKQKELIHGYYACVSYVDAQVGQLLQELNKLGLRDNTVVVLWGDHGWHLGDHGLWCKHSDFEQATHAPLIVSAPGMKGGQKAAAVVEFLDIFPTVCELAGLQVPKELDGVSLVPLLKDPSRSARPVAISQWPAGKAMGYALRDERYRYVEWITHGDSTKPYVAANVVGRELYDYQTDPLETKNAADDPAYREVAERMNRQLRAYFKQVSQ